MTKKKARKGDNMTEKEVEILSDILESWRLGESAYNEAEALYDKGSALVLKWEAEQKARGE